MKNIKLKNIVVYLVIYSMIFSPNMLVPKSASASNETVGEINPLIGNPVLMDAATCMMKYGPSFCRCDELESGNKACYYQKPTQGPFETEAACEMVWGEGGCDCNFDEVNQTHLCYAKTSDAAEPVSCEGEIQIYPGHKEECRQKGFFSNKCCYHEPPDDPECSFERIARKVGMEEAAIKAVLVAADFLGSDYVAEQLGQSEVFAGLGETMVENLFASESSELARGFGQKMLYDGLMQTTVGDFAQNTIQSGLEAAGISSLLSGLESEQILSDAVVAGSDAFIEAGGQAGGQAAFDAAQNAVSNEITTAMLDNDATQSLAQQTANKVSGDVTRKITEEAGKTVAGGAHAALISAIISIVSAMLDGEITEKELFNIAWSIAAAWCSYWNPYVGAFMTLVSIISTVSEILDMRECRVSEEILACKRGVGNCVKVGEYCSADIFGWCVQHSNTYCCFKSKLARIVHEQARPQIGMEWGDGEDPDCRGFRLREFQKIDWNKLDLGEYEEDVMRRVNKDFSEEKATEAIDRFKKRLQGF